MKPVTSCADLSRALSPSKILWTFFYDTTILKHLKPLDCDGHRQEKFRFKPMVLRIGSLTMLKLSERVIKNQKNDFQH